MQAFLFADDLEQLFVLVAAQLLLREKEHTDAVFPLLAQRDAGLGGSLFKELVANLQKNAHAVASFALGVLAGAVFQMFDDLQRIVNGFVALASLDVHHGANAAVVMFKLRIIEPGGRRALCKVFHPFCSFP